MTEPIEAVTGATEEKKVDPATNFEDVAKTVATTQTTNLATVTVNNMDELRQKAPEVFKLIQDGIMMRIKNDMDHFVANLKRNRRQYEGK